jgi:dTDP-4-dehydrorhamnose 3,5-epimerase
MRFIRAQLIGAFVVEPDRIEDERGFFARTFCSEEFSAQGLNPQLVQCSVSFNRRRGTLRGMHYQVAPSREAKLVRCTRGAVYDVILDLRPGSATYRQWTAAELTAENGRTLYVPEGVAHGFQTLADETEVFYQMSEFYAPKHGRGVRWSDPAFAIRWPISEPILSERDRTYPDFDRCRASS